MRVVWKTDGAPDAEKVNAFQTPVAGFGVGEVKDEDKGNQ